MWGYSHMSVVLLGLHHLVTNTQLVTWLASKFFFWWDGSKRKLCRLLTLISIWIISVNDMRVFGIASEEVRSVVSAHCLAHFNCFRRVSILVFVFHLKMECYKLQLLFKLSIVLVLLRYECLKLCNISAFRFSWCDRWKERFVRLQESLLLLLYDVVFVIWHYSHLFYWLLL